MRIPVTSVNNQPLLPTTPARARKWIESGKAVKRWSDSGQFYVHLTVEPSGYATQDIVMNPPELPLKLSFEEEFILIHIFPKELKQFDQEILIEKLLEMIASICVKKNLFSSLLKSNWTGRACEPIDSTISLSQEFLLEQCAREVKTATTDQLIELMIALKRQEMIYGNCLNYLKKFVLRHE